MTKRLIFIFLLLISSITAKVPADDVVPLQLDIHPLSQPKNEVDTETGGSRYVMDSHAIEALPQGEFSSFNDVLLQAPGVAQDSLGQLHVRGEHGNLQYRLNGILLPEGASGFGQALDSHIIDKTAFYTGALPAEYGYRTAGVVNITTKTSFENGVRTSLQVGSNETMDANQSAYGSLGPANLFFTGSVLSNNRGIEPPTAAQNPLHDHTIQDKEFGYMSYSFTPESRLTTLVGNDTQRFEIPNNPGQPQSFNLDNGSNFASASLNEHQFEHTTYAMTAFQSALGADTDYQTAYYVRHSNLLYKPDPVGDLLYNGVASRDERDNLTQGIQSDLTDRSTTGHTLKTGVMFQFEQATSNNNSLVFPGYYNTAQEQVIQTGTTPFSVVDNGYLTARLAGVYAQDSWRLTPKLTLNYGARFDNYSAAVSASQISPRVGAVYDVTPEMQLHLGYARYFTPPPTELIAPVALQAFANTTAASPTLQSSAVQPERANYLDAGVEQHLLREHLTLGLDAYYKQAQHVLDEGQFGQAYLFSPFNYARGWTRGVEFTSDYRQDHFSSYANLAVSKAMAKQVESGQYFFTPSDLSYIQSNAVHTDHDQLLTGSAGMSYRFEGFTYGADALMGSGLRSGFANTGHLPFYTQMNTSLEHTIPLGGLASVDAKFSILNLLDRVYEIRNGSGIGVFAPQYGIRRTFFLQISTGF